MAVSTPFGSARVDRPLSPTYRRPLAFATLPLTCRVPVEVVARQSVAADALRLPGVPGGRSFAQLPFPTLPASPGHALLARPGAVFACNQVVAAVRVAVSAVGLDGLVMRFADALSRCAAPPRICVRVGARLASTVTAHRLASVLWRELVAVDAVGLTCPGGGSRLPREDVDAGRDGPQVGRVHAPTMQARFSTTAVRAAVVALVVDLQVVRAAAVRRKSAHQHLERVTVSGDRSLLADAESSVPLRHDESRPMPAPVRLRFNVIPESTRQPLVPMLNHVSDSIRTPDAGGM